MSGSDRPQLETDVATQDDAAVARENTAVNSARQSARLERKEWLRWWIGLIVQPLVVLLLLTLLVSGVGVAQRLGLFQTEQADTANEQAALSDVLYICPMMCAAPQSEPGRCPVCAMELVPSTDSVQQVLSNFVNIDGAARRLANIQTMPVSLQSAVRNINAVGEIGYDETRLRTLSAYFDGRVESLYADYTGAVVAENDRVALIYSPELYVAQVEHLIALERDEAASTTNSDIVQSINLARTTRTRLIEFGMSEEQIQVLEQSGEAKSRLDLLAPISGTVIKKYVVEGEYISEGEPICDLADLSNVWLMLQLFPEDAATVRFGQRVRAEIQSLPGMTFEGRIAFIDRDVDPETRTVGVRVEIPNPDGRLRIGDYGRARVDVSVNVDATQTAPLFDPFYAQRFVCPNHPYETSTTVEECSICNSQMVPASNYGYVDEPLDANLALLIPRDAVLMNGENSVVYVEVSSGRFELREVVLGPTIGEQIAVRSGISSNELVATRGNFLIDSQMQLASNPSLIDPTKALFQGAGGADELPPNVLQTLAELSSSDRKKALDQMICPITQSLLGSMGPPEKIVIDGREVFICCSGCEERFRSTPESYFDVIARAARGRLSQNEDIVEAMAELSDEDRSIAQDQIYCPVGESPLGAMGVPIKVMVDGDPVFICCEACRKPLLDDPDRYISTLHQGIQSSTEAGNSSPAIPSIGPIQRIDRLQDSSERPDDDAAGDDQ